MSRRPDEGQERLVREALAASVWMRGSRRSRLARCASYLLVWWLVLALLGWALAVAFGAAVVPVVCIAAAALGLAFFVGVFVKPAAFVRWSVLSSTTSDEAARKGFPGGGA